MLTAKKFAERAGITYPTVIAWLKKGLIPKAKFIEKSPLGPYWEIPAASLAKVQKQKTGPKPKSLTDSDQETAGDQVKAPADGQEPATPKRRASKRSSAKKAMKKSAKKGARAK